MPFGIIQDIVRAPIGIVHNVAGGLGLGNLFGGGQQQQAPASNSLLPVILLGGGAVVLVLLLK